MGLLIGEEEQRSFAFDILVLEGERQEFTAESYLSRGRRYESLMDGQLFSLLEEHAKHLALDLFSYPNLLGLHDAEREYELRGSFPPYEAVRDAREALDTYVLQAFRVVEEFYANNPHLDPERFQHGD